MDDRTARPARSWLTWLPPALWMIVIFAGSSLPGSAIPGNLSVPGHLSEYGILGALVFVALRHSPLADRAAWLALAVSSAYGVTDELHQLLVPGRMADPLDWGFDTLGAAIGIAVAAFAISLLLSRAHRQ